MVEDPTDERLAALVTRLSELTRAGRVRWELAETGRDDSFTYATPSGAVTVFSRDYDGRDPYVFSVRDADGRLAERTEFRKDSEDAELYQMVTALYRVARRQALGTTAVIEAMLRDLG